MIRAQHTYMYISICLNAYIYIHLYLHMSAICVHTYMHACRHAYIHTSMHACITLHYITLHYITLHYIHAIYIYRHVCAQYVYYIYITARCSPRTRMLTRMLMVQMSKHMDMQSRRTLFCNSLFERCSKLQLKLNGNYSSLREILACAILARPQWELARGQFFKLSLRDLARRWIPEIWCIFAVHISPVTSLQCGVWSVACGV